MPSLLRARIECFCCGTKSKYRKGDHVRDFQCVQCEATNYLDERGEITDPPYATSANTTPQAPRYATSRSPPPPTAAPTSHNLSASSPSQQDSIFCSTCLKNQQFLTSCLANYLPPETDPRYAGFEAAYPEYRAQLERRYPPVCPKCEPRVRDRLKKSVRVARSDALSRKLGGIAGSGQGGAGRETNLIVCGLLIAEALWWIAQAVQGAWHFAGATGMLQGGDGAGFGDFDDQGLGTCILVGARTRTFGLQCSSMLARYTQYALILTALLLWWNPHLKDVYGRIKVSDRATGFAEFYQFQLLILVIRAAALWKLRGTDTSDGIGIGTGVHAFMAFFIGLAVVLSYRMIHAPGPYKISWKESNVPLVDEASFQYPSGEFTSQRSPNQPHGLAQQTPTKPFSISSLAPRAEPAWSVSSVSTAKAPPSPPETESDLDPIDAQQFDADSMDWEPASARKPNSVQNYNLRSGFHGQDAPAMPVTAWSSTSRSTLPGQAVTSPFYGQLPPAPKSAEHRLRNNARQPPPAFRPNSESKQNDWFQKMGLSNSASLSWTNPISAPRADRIPASSLSSKETSYVQRAQDEPGTQNLRAAKWTLQSDLDRTTRGTGLEDLFTSSFNIKDEGAASAQDPALESTGGSQTGAVNAMGVSLRRMISFLILPLLFMILAIVFGSVIEDDRTGGLLSSTRLLGQRIIAWSYGE